MPIRSKIQERYNLLCFCDRSWIFSVAFAGYEILPTHDEPARDELMNWTLASETYPGKGELPLASIKNIEQLCEAQTEIDTSFNYWTALKLNSMGFYQWGRQDNDTTSVIEPELLDRTEPVDRCYVINKSAMKLLSEDCDSLQGVLLSHTNDEGGKQTISSSHQKRIHVFLFRST